MTTVLFIHGTGVRERGFATTFGLVTNGLRGVRPDVTAERCYWGEIGAELRADGASLSGGAAVPAGHVATMPGNGSGAQAVPDEERELARWARLLVDPLFEIRLRQLVGPVPASIFPTTTLAERVNVLPDVPGVAAELVSHGLTGAFAAAVSWVTGSAEFAQAFGQEAIDDGATNALLTRALVARCLAVAADQDGIELSGEGRDQLVSAVAAGLGAPDHAIGDWVGEMAKSVAFSAAGPPLRRRRRAYIQSVADILLYQAHGDAIRQFVRDRIRQLSGPVVLLAHSLGGVIAFDLLCGPHARDLAEVRLLITVGSQVPLLYELGALPSGVAYPAAVPACFSPAWANVYDDRDLLAYVGGDLFGTRCKDIRVDTRAPFPTAHSAYWDLRELYRRLAEVMEREGL